MQRLHRPPRVLPELEGHDILGGLAAGVGRAVLGGFNSIVDAIFGTVNNDYVAALPVIDDHSRTLSTLRAELEQMTLQGLARVFTSNATYLASPGTVSADVVLLGAGGGGGTGRWNLLSATRYGGSGGGGGGEIHFSIHGSNLFEPNGNPRPIPILVGVGGAGGIANEQAGTGGGDSSFDGIVAYGGQGGKSGGGGGGGGYGIVIGGSAAPDFDTPDSLSSFGLYGGGGAGGRGATASGGMTAGGRGGLNAGGPIGQNAPAVSRSTTTGGGGGGGGGAQQSGGHGAAPGGGGGGGGGGSSSSNFGKGGSGANAIAYVIERRV